MATIPPCRSYVDTHTHLDYTWQKMLFVDGWAPFRARVLNDPNLEKVITVACDIPSFEIHETFAHTSDDLFVTFGLHPHNAKEYNDDVEQRIADMITRNRPRALAWGECGLDYHYNLSPQDVQRHVFVRQIRVRRC